MHNGRVVKRTGDGALVEFRSVVNALRCAVDVQNSMVERNAGLPAERRIEFRIGIHLGDIVEESDGDLMGDGVNIAARLEGIAQPGAICLSEDAYRQVKARPNLSVSDRAGCTKAAPASLTLPDKPSIAVLAFTNMSGDPEQEYFSDVISEDIITDLSKLSELYVIARNSSFTYKGKPVDVKQVGRELGVRYVLEGIVRKAGNRVRVTGQLIEATSGAHIWANRFDRDLADIFAVQDELTREIIEALKIRLSARETASIASVGTKNVNAHDLFLKGRELLIGNKRDREMFAQVNTYLLRAVEIDPNYASPMRLSHGLMFLIIRTTGATVLRRHWTRQNALSSRRSRRMTKTLSCTTWPPWSICGEKIMSAGPMRPKEP